MGILWGKFAIGLFLNVLAGIPMYQCQTYTWCGTIAQIMFNIAGILIFQSLTVKEE